MNSAEPDNHNNKPKSLTRWQRWLSILVTSVLVIFCLIWLFSPMIVRYQANKFLAVHALKMSPESSVRFNPFLFKTSITDTALVSADSAQPLLQIDSATIDIRVWPLFSKTLEFEVFEMADIRLKLDVGSDGKLNSVAGIDVASATQQEPSVTSNGEEPGLWRLETAQAEISRMQIDLSHGQTAHQIAVELLSLSKTLWALENISSTILLKASLAGSKVQLEHQVAMDAEAGEHEIAINISQLPLSSFTYLAEDQLQELAGQISLFSRLRFSHSSSGWQSQLQRLSLSLEALNLKSHKWQASGKTFNLELTDSDLASDSSGVKAKVMQMDFQADTVEAQFDGMAANLSEPSLTMEQSQLQWQAEGQDISTFQSQALSFEDKNIKLESDDWRLNSESNRIDLSDVLFQHSEDNIPDASANLTFKTDHTRLTVQSKATPAATKQSESSISQAPLIAGFQSLDLAPTRLRLGDGQSLTAVSSGLDIGAMLISDPDSGTQENSIPPIAILQQLNINQFTFQENHLSIDQVIFDGLQAAVMLDETRQMANLVSLPTQVHTEQQGSLPVEQSESTPPAITFSVASITLTPASQLALQDLSLEPDYNQNLLFERFSLTRLDNRPAADPAEIDLAFRTDQYSTAEVKGRIFPFSDKTNLDLSLQIKEFSVPKVSPYLREAAGFDLLSGLLDSQTRLSIKDNQLSGESHVEVKGLQLSDAPKNTQAELSAETSIPLNTALSMLTDSDGNLELDVPFEGDISSPEFGLAGFITLVTKKAALAATEHYLIQSFIPYANVITIARIAGGEIFRTRFEDLNYQPAQIEPDEAQKEFLNQFAELLKAKPDANIKVCAFAVPEEITPAEKNTEASASDKNENQQTQPTQALKAIAEQRAQAFKSWVIENAGIESSRLILCQPQVDQTTGSQPRIEFET